jgi:membrane protein DedA with SNARE-associated domain
MLVGLRGVVDHPTGTDGADRMSDGQSNRQLTLREWIACRLLGLLVSFGVFLGTAYVGMQLDRWAYPNLQNRSGDAFLSLCISVILALVAWWGVKRLTRS